MVLDNISVGKTLPLQNKSRKAYRSNSLTLEEQERLLSVCETFEDLVLFKLVLSTGIRREDITSIELGNIDLANRQLRFWEGKKRRWWEVPLTLDVIQELRRYMNTLPKGQKTLFNFTGRTAYNHLQKYIKKAGIKKQLSFHDLRRTFVKTAKRKGLSPKAVSQITGDQLSTIELYYSNLDMEELKEEVDKL